MRKALSIVLFSSLVVPPALTLATEPNNPTPQIPMDADPAVRMAGKAARVIERDEAIWRELTDRLAKAVEAYNPSFSVDPLPEDQALQAFKGYCSKLLESGREVAAVHARWADARAALADSVRKSPAYYRSAAKTLLERAESVRSESVREKYRLAADVWERLAVRAEERAKQIGADDPMAGVADLLAQENQFLQDFLKTLDALPRPGGPNQTRARR
jgi:hypothetical protein